MSARARLASWTLAMSCALWGCGRAMVSSVDAGADAIVDADTPSMPGPSQVTCADRQGAVGDQTISIPTRGAGSSTKREALVHVPPSYDATRGASLMLVFHRCTSSDLAVRSHSQLNSVADARGFIVAYMQGRDDSWNAADCGLARSTDVDDAGYVLDMIDFLTAQYCIDPGRVYAVGEATGGRFVHRLGCELSSRFAAIGSIGGSADLVPDFDPPTLSACLPPRAVSVAQLDVTSNGAFDPLIAETVQRWRQIDGCVDNPKQTFATATSTCELSSSCQEGTAVLSCRSTQTPFCFWLGSDDCPDAELDARTLLVDFFSAHVR